MRIMILGAGVQGALYGVRLARAGHDVTLIARGKRMEELLQRGAVIEDALSAQSIMVQLPITERLTRETHADLCLVAVRREQINEVLPDLMTASAIGRIVFMVNHANGSEQMFKALGRARVVLAFPGAAGSVEGGGPAGFIKRNVQGSFGFIQQYDEKVNFALGAVRFFNRRATKIQRGRGGTRCARHCGPHRRRYGGAYQLQLRPRVLAHS